jgi:hypothetical protein
MNRIFVILTVLVFAEVASAATPSVKTPVPAAVVPAAPVVPAEEVALSLIDSGDLFAAGQQLSAVTDPVAKLFVQARMEQAKGDAHRAIQTLSTLIVNYSSNARWMEKSDLLSIELYMELGLLHAADVAARQVETLYEGTDAAQKATGLRAEIKKLEEDAK